MVVLGVALIGSASVRDEPPLVYGSDAGDAWNRIFHHLFTRTVRATVQGGTRLVDRVEDGDRAVEALYPSFMTWSGPADALREPRRSLLKQALSDALSEKADRPDLHRALMQADLWSAYDALFPIYRLDLARRNREDAELKASAGEIVPLVAHLIRKLALTPEQIAGLPDNYAAAVRSQQLPDLFSADSPWMEIVWFPRRMHDEAAQFRRATRVFVRSRVQPTDAQKFLDGLRGQHADGPALAAVALVMQDLLVDTRGCVVPTRLIYTAQTRTFRRDARGAVQGTDLAEYELSRARLLAAPATGGLVAFAEDAPDYLPIAGNDYGFATPQRGERGDAPPILATLRARCAQCHGLHAQALFTFNMIHAPGDPVPPVRRLDQPNDDRARDVASHKAQRDDFETLIEQWRGR